MRMDEPTCAIAMPAAPDRLLTELLRRCSYHAERVFKKRHGQLASQLWLAEDANSRRFTRDTACVNAPAAASDMELIAALAEDMHAEFAARDIVRFAVAYPARRTTLSQSAIASTQPARFSRDVVVIEAHSVAGHWRAEREIIAARQRRQPPTLAALSPIEAGDDGIYVGLLA